MMVGSSSISSSNRGSGTNALTYYYLDKPVRIIKLFSLLRGKKNEQAGWNRPIRISQAYQTFYS
jgi:hypothetical protein